MAVTKVQQKTHLLVANGTSDSATFDAPAAAGNLLVMQHWWETNSVSDNVIPTGWAQAGEIRYSSGVATAEAIYYKIAAGGETTLGADTGAVSCLQGVTISEYTGGTGYTLDQVATNTAGGVTSITSPTITTTQPDELIIYAIAAHGTVAFSNTWTNGFARVDSASAPSTARMEMGYLVVSSTGSYNTAETVASARSLVGIIVSFQVTPTAQTTSVTINARPKIVISMTKNATPQSSKPTSDVSNAGAWTKQDGTTTTNLWQTVDDTPTTDDADYMQSPSNPTAAAVKERFAAVAVTGSTAGWRLRVRARITGTGSTTCAVTILQGATTIATRTLTGLTSAFADYYVDLTSGEAALITGPNATLDALITAG